MHVRCFIKMNDTDTRKPVRNLADSIHSLLGFKAHLTSAWVSSVCSIIRSLPSEAAPSAQLVAQKDFEEHSSLRNNEDSNMDVIKTKDELPQLLSLLNQLNAQRRQLLTEFLDLKGNKRVFCRIRPIQMRRNFNHMSPVIVLNSNNLLLQVSASKSKHYSFDKVFQPNSSQDDVFQDIEPIIKSVIDGYNACIFAYGQTGSGKTYTMEGTPENPGVVQRGIEALFKQATVSNQELIITFSMVEIYLGHLKDLLVPHYSRVSDPVPPCLSVQTDPKGGIQIDNLISVQVTDSEQALQLYTLGCQLRSTASTNFNKTSSRSHCMIRIKINSINAPERRRETNKLWMVDLGGSERVLKTKAQGRRFEEGKAINLSLSALGDVVDALQRKRCHIPYRNNKLTLVLQDCLGDDSKTLMLVHVSPEEEDICESVCSLNLATRARSIHLDDRESQGVKECKKAALIALQQKMEHIEDERQEIQSKIEMINKTLERLTKTSDLPNRLLVEDSHPFMVASKSDTNSINKFSNLRKLPSLELPRFMQPTVSSTRKSGVEHTYFEDKSTAPSRNRRRSISHRANSVTFPLKRNVVYSSDISLSSVEDLNMINNELEHSQGISECDTQTTNFQIQDKILKSRRKWESRWPIQEKYTGVRGQKQKERLQVPVHKARISGVSVNYNATDNEYGQLNITQSKESPKSFAMNRYGSAYGFPKVDIDCSTRRVLEVRNECDYTNDLEEQEASVPATYEDFKHSQNDTMDRLVHTPNSQYKKYAEFSQPFDDSLSMPKTYCDTLAMKNIIESMDATFEGLAKEKTEKIHRSQTHRALFTYKLKEDEGSVIINTDIVHSRVIPQVTGLLTSIKLKIQMLYFCASMWLNFWNLVYDDDFFYSLTQ